MRILLTNDDGIYALGLRALYASLRKAGHEVHVFAPMTEQSAVGHSITINGPLRVKHLSEPGFEGTGVFGTPTDCVKLAASTLLQDEPDIVVSGINAGANVGPDILYSGTVAAATEGAHLGLPALAISYDSFAQNADLSAHADFALTVMDQLDWKSLPPRRVINLNLPALPVDQFKGLRVCPQTSAVWHDWYETHKDPRGNSFWWLDGKILPEHVAPNTDKDLLSKGYATLTPLRFDFTDADTLKVLEEGIEVGGATP